MLDDNSRRSADIDSYCPAAADDGKAVISACPVCEHGAAAVFQSIDGKTYWRCHACIATFADRGSLPTIEEERRHYASHQNSVDDPGYRRFLSRLADPLLERLPPAQNGLDFGCGPGPALAAMLREAGHEMHIYDPLFVPDRAALGRKYDFITCSETAEHFHAPANEFSRLKEMVRPGGVLAVMTCFQANDARFADWHYRKDPTHVVFYREETFRRLAAQWGWRADIPVKDVVLLFKPNAVSAGQ